MVLVDSSVWIDYLSLESSRASEKLEALIRPAVQAVITGIIFQEVLQGIRNVRSYEITQKFLGRLPFVIPSIQSHLKATELFRQMASLRKTPSTIDVLIAALAIENRIPLFTLDKEFQTIQKYSDLKIYT